MVMAGVTFCGVFILITGGLGIAYACGVFSRAQPEQNQSQAGAYSGPRPTVGPQRPIQKTQQEVGGKTATPAESPVKAVAESKGVTN